MTDASYFKALPLAPIVQEGNNGSGPVLGESKEVSLWSLFHGSSQEAGRRPWWTWDCGNQEAPWCPHGGI